MLRSITGFGGGGPALIALFMQCLFGLSNAALAQGLSLGVVAGANLTQDFQYRVFNQNPDGSADIAYSTPKRWIIGGSVEVRLPRNFAVKVDGLYHELEFTNAAVRSNGSFNSVSPAPVVTWEIPALIKYRFPLRRLKPFAEAGPSFRISYNLNGTSPSNRGFTTGAGIEVSAWKARIAPEFRYTRWAEDRLPNVLPISPLTVPDQVQFLVGISLRFSDAPLFRRASR